MLTSEKDHPHWTKSLQENDLSKSCQSKFGAKRLKRSYFSFVQIFFSFGNVWLNPVLFVMLSWFPSSSSFLTCLNRCKCPVETLFWPALPSSVDAILEELQAINAQIHFYRFYVLREQIHSPIRPRTYPNAVIWRPSVCFYSNYCFL